HWILYNIPVDTKTIDNDNLDPQIKSGFTSFQRTGCGGPSPPNGVHRYFFKLYAINKQLNLPDGITKEQLLEIIDGSVVEYTELIGLYQRNV
ncbi:YbhB/YbcL family Raf kinase inhibitor-like protein, partial [bacterium]|nr:YbhB/YbcL family Raf kinase inhibitor-like protein [bacterium]